MRACRHTQPREPADTHSHESLQTHTADSQTWMSQNSSLGLVVVNLADEPADFAFEVDASGSLDVVRGKCNTAVCPVCSQVFF
eukprot:COSAG02_NODE_1129_length_14415_cov_828.291911_8_plen_83_part_00